MKISWHILVVAILLAASTLRAQSQISISPTQGLPTIQGNVAAVSASWTSSSTAAATCATAACVTITIQNYSVVMLSISKSGTITGGVVTFEISDDGGTTWYPANGTLQGNNGQGSSQILNGTIIPIIYQFNVAGATTFHARLSTAIAGSGTITIRLSGNAGGVVGPISLNGGITDVVGNQADNANLQGQLLGVAAGEYNSALPTITSGNGVVLQTDVNGRLLVSSIVNALPTGSNTIGKVDVLGNAGGTLDAATNGANPGNQLWMVPTPTTASGAAITSFEADAVTTSTTVKSSAGNFYGYLVTNTNSSTCYLQVFNTTSPTLGTTAPIISIGIPATAAANISLHYPVPFSTAIAVASTTASKGASTCGTGMTMTILYQ